MSRSQLIRHWERDLRGLSDTQLRDRLSLAVDFEERSKRPGMGRATRRLRATGESGGDRSSKRSSGAG